MKEFLLILFFAKELLLTPVPVSFNGSLIVVPEKPVSAITKGATLQIDVTQMVPVGSGGLFRYWETGEFKRQFPPGALSASLVEVNGRTTVLHYEGQAAISKDRLWLVLGNDKTVPTGVQFVKISIFSEIPLENVKIYWRNYAK